MSTVQLERTAPERGAHANVSRHRSRSPFVPALLVACAVLVWVVFQSVQLVSTRDALTRTKAVQQPQIQQSQKLRTALNSLAADTQKLADSGNTNAKLLVQELRNRGVTINLKATEAVPPPP